MSTPCSTYVVVLPALQRRQWTKTGSLLDAKKFYVGSTTKTVHQRHDARIRKLRLLQQGQFTNTEIMVHYFHNHADLFDTVILPLGTFPDKVSVRAAECKYLFGLLNVLSYIPGNLALTCLGSLISTQPLQPVRRSRPCPIVNTVVLENAYGGRHADDFAHWVIILRCYSSQALCPQENWALLVKLAHGGMSAFNTERRLRSSEFHAAHLYALYRMCNLLDDPPRTAVKATLHSCLTFRNLAVPKFGKPLTIPMLANMDTEPYSSVQGLPHPFSLTQQNSDCRYFSVLSICALQQYHSTTTMGLGPSSCMSL